MVGRFRPVVYILKDYLGREAGGSVVDEAGLGRGRVSSGGEGVKEGGG